MERIVKVFGMDMYTLLCLKWIINKDQPIVYHRNSA